MKKLITVIISLLLSIVGSSLPATADNAPYESRLTVTVTSSETGTGAGRTLTYTAVISDSQSLLVYGSSPTGSEVQIMGLVVFLCSSQQTGSYGSWGAPSGCSFVNGGSSNSGTSSTYTLSRSYSGSDLATLEASPYIVPTVHFQDQSVNKLGIHGNSTGNSISPSSSTPAQTPSYTGPKISSFNLGSVAAGGSLVATGKRLNTVQSATIGGLAAGITASTDVMEISVPEALLPGTYDLVMQTSHGVLTHINAVVVRAKPELSVITIRGTGNSISEDLATELAAISELHASGYNKIHCLVNMEDASAAEAIAAAACDLLKLGSLADATTLTTLKSSFKGSGFWLRIYMAG